MCDEENGVKGVEGVKHEKRVQRIEPDEGMRVIVDADACPRGAMSILLRLQSEYGYHLTTVASFHHHIQSDDHITVGDAPDEADLKIASLTRKHDIVVTQDLGLAALVLAKGGKAVTPKGVIVDAQSLDFLLDERHLKAKHRRAGGRTRGPKAREHEDDRRFESALRLLLAKASSSPANSPPPRPLQD